MSDPPPPGADAEPTPAERRLLELLGPLREHPPIGAPGTAVAVAQRARWQGPLRTVLQTAGHLVSAVGDAIGVALGLGRSEGRGGDR